MNTSIDARNVSTDTLLVVKWSLDTTPSMWKWEVITRGTVGYGGTLADTNYQGFSQCLDIAIMKGTEKMLQVCPLDVVGAGTTWHTTSTNIIRTSNGKPSPRGWVGARGGWLTSRINTKDSIKGSG